MKNFFVTLCLLTASLCAFAQNKSELRFKYIEKNLGVDQVTLKKLAPTIKGYIKEMKEAGDIYNDVKDEFKDNIKKGKLSEKQAAKLNQSKINSETKELQVRNKYYAKFKALTNELVIYRIFKLANDKKSKFMPAKKKSSDDDED